MAPDSENEPQWIFTPKSFILKVLLSSTSTEQTIEPNSCKSAMHFLLDSLPLLLTSLPPVTLSHPCGMYLPPTLDKESFSYLCNFVLSRDLSNNGDFSCSYRKCDCSSLLSNSTLHWMLHFNSAEMISAWPSLGIAFVHGRPPWIETWGVLEVGGPCLNNITGQ